MVKVANSQVSSQGQMSQVSVRVGLNSPTPSSVSHVSSSWEMVRAQGCLAADPISNKGRKLQLSKMVIITMVPILVLLVETMVIIGNSVVEVKGKEVIRENIQFSIQTGEVVHLLQIERGATALYVTATESRSIIGLLETARRDTDKAIFDLPRWPEYADKKLPHYGSTHAFYSYIVSFRDNLNLTHHNVTREVILFYSDVIHELVSWVARAVQSAPPMESWPMLVAYHKLMISKEQAGQERAIGGTFFTMGELLIFIFLTICIHHFLDVVCPKTLKFLDE